jgi:hypothetical protein
MKYIVRAVKYFFYFSIITVILMSVLVLLKVVDPNIETMFRNGYNSLWQIAIMFAVIAAFYPMFGFMEKDALIPGEFEEIKKGVVAYMEDSNYRLEREEGENMTFRLKNPVNRLSRMFEDRITFTRNATGFRLEGLRKDVVRTVNGLEYRFRHEEDGE